MHGRDRDFESRPGFGVGGVCRLAPHIDLDVAVVLAALQQHVAVPVFRGMVVGDEDLAVIDDALLRAR